jgi:predicted peroxiredoxin
MSRSLVVKVTVGAEAPEKANQAFMVAATGLAAGAAVSVWLTGNATWFAVPGKAEAVELPHATPIAELRDTVLAGGTVTVCTQCAARRDLGEQDFVEGVRIAGAASFVEEALTDGAQALIY